MPAVPGVRPTPDRVRETLFNWLGQDLSGASCLDLFAGSGALGLEALSRGARRVIAVERDPRVARVLRQNAESLAAENFTLVCADAPTWLAGSTERFDVIFADPPFDLPFWPEIWPRLAERLAPGGVVYAESGVPLALPAGWMVEKSGRSGMVYHALVRYEDSP